MGPFDRIVRGNEIDGPLALAQRLLLPAEIGIDHSEPTHKPRIIRVIPDSGFHKRSPLFEKLAGPGPITPRPRGAGKKESFHAIIRWRKLLKGEVDQQLLGACEIPLQHEKLPTKPNVHRNRIPTGVVPGIRNRLEDCSGGGKIAFAVH